MRKVLATLVVAFAVLVAPVDASAVTLVLADGQIAEPYQRWADASQVPTVGGKVEFRHAGCPIPPATACVDAWGTIYIPPAPGYRRFALLHELGHVFDRLMSPAARGEFLVITGQAGEPWRQVGVWSPAEQFADAYANCAMGNHPDGRWQTGYLYYPSARTQRRVCALIRRIGPAHMTSVPR